MRGRLARSMSDIGFGVGAPCPLVAGLDALAAAAGVCACVISAAVAAIGRPSAIAARRTA
jgi:hypothetical protein